MPCHNYNLPGSRREFLQTAGSGFGSLALSAMTGQNHLKGAASSPSSPKITHRPGRAKNVIWLFMEGGPSHLDIFDPKPLVNKLAGQKLPPSFTPPITAMGEINAPILESKRTWKQHGKSGLWISDWLPEHSKIADDLCVIHSCVTDGINHAGGVCEMNTGFVFGGRPSLGSWVTYGLGSVNQNMPGFVVMKDSNASITNGNRCWGSGFMPASYQGVLLEPGDEPIANLNLPKGISNSRNERKLAFINQLNQQHYETRQDNSELEARIRSYELAYRMQAEAPETVDISKEPDHIKKLYGLDDENTKAYGQMCLLARRMVENGVRFIQLYHGAGSKWDSHSGMEKHHPKLCSQIDKPIVGLITDLKQRGLLEDTLIVWGGEFGRTPMSEKGDGRDHNPTGFTMWFAGGGVEGGQTIGATDDLGLYAIDDKMHVHDIHSTILGLLGLDHKKVVYMHKGRPERVDLNEGHVHKTLVPEAG
jgi:hypothetical protein